MGAGSYWQVSKRSFSPYRATTGLAKEERSITLTSQTFTESFRPRDYLWQQTLKNALRFLEANIGFLREEMREVRKDIREMRGALSGVRTELGGEIAIVRAELSGEIAGLRSSTSKNFEDVRVQFADVRVQAEKNFRLLFGALIAGALCLAGLLAKGFHWF